MNRLITFTLLLGVTVALPQKKVIDPVKDIKFDHHDEEHDIDAVKDHHIDVVKDHHIDAVKDHHDDVAHEVDHHEIDHHKALDHHNHQLAQYEHKLLHRAHALAEHEHALAEHEHALTKHEHALANHLHPHPPTTFLLVPLPHAVVPVKPGTLYDPHVKKHALFVPAAQHH